MSTSHLSQAKGSEHYRLTVREAQVLLLAARGLADQEIAEYLGLARPTVSNLVGRVRVKIGARDRTALAHGAGRHGL